MAEEEGHAQAEVARELGIAATTLSNWIRAYREEGAEAGLLRETEPERSGGGVSRARPPGGLQAPVREKIVELKKENRGWGSLRIAQVLRRLFLMEASPETVRRTLHGEKLIEPKPSKPARNPSKPRRFERARPNQMWQSDIFTFRLGGQYAYLIGYLDDYSRYIVGAEIFRSQTAQSVIEVYRRATGEYGVPKEMLTDNGRQYATWRGTSRFQKEMQKDRVAHIRSRPQHPMTLGKIERFWGSIWREFLGRAQFEDFEAARARIRLWIQYYNHKRPHQGLRGLCPADRFFEIQHELRKTLEEGIRENVLEMALRGRPVAPFYMVGRMQGQSVVLRAEKGKLKLRVEDDATQSEHELEYDLKEDRSHGAILPQEEPPFAQDGQTPPPPTLASLPSGGESPGGAGGLDRESEPERNLPADADQLRDLPELAEAGHGGDAPSAGGPCPSHGWGGLEPAPAPSHRTAAPDPGDEPGRPAAPDPGNAGRARQEPFVVLEYPHVQEESGPGETPGRDHPPGQGRATDGHRGGRDPGSVAQDLLRVGEAGASGDAHPPREPGPGPASEPGARRGEDPAREEGGGPRETPRLDGGSPRPQDDAQRPESRGSAAPEEERFPHPPEGHLHFRGGI